MNHRASQHQANQQQEADTNELGERAALGLRDENWHLFGRSPAEGAISRRAGEDGMGDIPERRRW